MTKRPCSQLLIIAWSFVVRPEHRRDFERAYGQRGDWVRLFRTGDGYIKTELHRDPENTAGYITLDFWRGREQYEAFRERAKSAYQEIDARLERLTENEELLGDFGDLSRLHAALPRLGAATQVELAVTVRAAQANDIPGMLRLDQSACSAAHWTHTAYDAIFQTNAPPRIAIVAEKLERQLSGFVIARIVADECELENIVVNGADARRGVGSALLDKLIELARGRGIRRIFLEVRESNLAARGLYAKFAFACVDERSAYYSNPVEKAIVYSLGL